MGLRHVVLVLGDANCCGGVLDFGVGVFACCVVRPYACEKYPGGSHKQCMCLLLARDGLVDKRGCFVVVIGIPYFMFIRTQPL